MITTNAKDSQSCAVTNCFVCITSVEPLPERLLEYYELGAVLLKAPGTIIRKCEDR